jgi:hypothetical protein
MTEEASISLRTIGVIHEFGSGTVYVDEVEGEKVRDLVDVDFVAGGNPARYAYIQRMHIWIEAKQSQKDKAATIVHELIEYVLMKSGKSYEEAHGIAARWEKQFRARVESVGPGEIDPLLEASRFLAAHALLD